MKIKKAPTKRLAPLPKPLPPLITTLSTTPAPLLPPLIAHLLQSWPYPKTDLFHWVGVLNHFDSILEGLVNQYELKRVQEKEFEKEDKEAVVAILEFTTVLMENCTNRNLYCSYEHLSDLMHTSDLDVLNASLRLLFRSAQRMHNQRSLRTAFGTSQDHLITLAQHWGPKDSSVSFTQLAAGKVEPHPEWLSVTYQFYRSTTSSESKIDTAATTTTPPKTPKKGAAEKPSSSDGLVTISVNNVMESGKSSRDLYQELVEKYEVPVEHRFALYQRVRVAFGLADSQERKKLLLSRINAIAVLAILVSEDIAQNKIFLYEPDLVQKLADLCSAEKEVDYDLQIAALHALDSISSYRTKLSEVLTAINASANHGILMYILRKTVTEMDKDECTVPAQYVDSLFGFISRLCATQSGGTMLVSAGLVPTLIHLLDNRRESQIKVITKTVAMMDNILFGFTTAFTSFIQANGLDVLVLRIKDEVDYFVELEKELGDRMETDGSTPEIPHERTSFLRSMLKFVLHMMQSTHSNDRLRNLIDTTLPHSLLAIFEHVKTLGATAFGLAVNIMSTFIHNEPTCLTILQEAKLPQTFLQAVSKDIPVSAEVVSALPHAFGAICLNQAGLDHFNEVKPLPKYLDIFTNEEHFRALSENEVPSIIGSSVDELIRHHPTLKGEVMEGIVRVLKKVAEFGEGLPVEECEGSVLAVVKTDADVAMLTAEEVKAMEEDRDKTHKESKILFLVDVVARFMEGLFQNVSHVRDFIALGGAELLVRLYSLPSFPYDFASSGAAYSGSEEDHQTIEQGNRILRALINLNGMVHLLSDIFCTNVLSHTKSINAAIQTFGEEADQLIKSLGQLYRTAIWEKNILRTSVPKSWYQGKPKKASDRSNTGYMSRRVDNVDVDPLDLVLPASDVASTQAASAASGEGKEGTSAAAAGASTTAPADVADPDDPRVKNVRWLKWLLTHIPGVMTPLFQGILKLLTARRIQDANNRKVAMKVIEDLAVMLRDHLTWPRGAEGSSIETYNYLVIVLGIVSVMTIEERNVLQLQTWLAVAFVKASGLDQVFSILKRLWSAAQALNTEEELSKDEKARDVLARIHSGINMCITFLQSLVQHRVLHESPHTALLANREKDKKSPDYFDAHEHLVEMRARSAPYAAELWRDEYLTKCPTDVVQGIVLLLSHLLKAEGETKTARPDGPANMPPNPLGGLASLIGRAMGGPPPAPVAPDEGKIQMLVDMGFPRAAAETALVRCGNNVARAADYLISHPEVVDAARFSAEADAANAAAASGAAQAGPAGGEGSSSAAGPAEGAAATDAGGSAQEGDGASNGEGSGAQGDDEGDEDMMDEDDLAAALALSMGAPPADSMQTDSPVAGEGSAAEPASGEQHVAEEGTAAKEDKGKGKEVGFKEQLEEIRKALKEDLVVRSLVLLDHIAGVVFEVKELLAHVFKDSVEGLATNMVTEIEKEREAAVVEGAKSDRLNVRLRLFALLVNDEKFQNKIVLATPQFLQGLLKMMGVDGTCTPWLSHVLLILEAYLSLVDEPRQVGLTHNADGSTKEVVEVANERPQIGLEDRRVLIGRVVSLLRLEEIDKDMVHALLRLAVRLTRHHTIAVEFAKLDGVPLLFNSSRIGAFHAQQAMTVMILRHIIEDANVLRQTMEQEIALFMSLQRPSRVIAVSSLAKNNGHIVCRDEGAFVDSAVSVVKIQRFSVGAEGSSAIVLRTKEGEKEREKAKEKEGGEGGAKPMETEEVSIPGPGAVPIEEAGNVFAAPPQFQSQYLAEVSEGVVHFLVTEVLALKTAHVQGGGEKVQGTGAGGDFSASAGGSSSTAVASDAVTNDAENVNHIRRCFLLQCLAELVVSYPSCKVDVMNASQKRGGKNTPHKISQGRNAFLAHLLSDLLPHGVNHGDGANPTTLDTNTRKKLVESTWATSVLSGLCVGVTADLAEEKEKYPDLVNVRKTVLDAVVKSLRDAMGLVEAGTETRFGRFLAVSDLCYKILTARNPAAAAAAASTSGRAHEDIPMHVAKVMLEKGFVNLFTQMLSEVDVHHPNSRMLLNAILKPLEFLTKAAIKIGRAADIGGKKGRKKFEREEMYDEFPAGQDGEVEEEVPDMYRNSALGVFDARGSDEDMDETDSEDDEEDYDEYSEDEDEEDEDRMDEGSDVDDEMEIVMPSTYHGAHDMDITDEDEEDHGSEDDDEDVLEEGEEVDEGDEMSWEDEDQYEDVDDDEDVDEAMDDAHADHVEDEHGDLEDEQDEEEAAHDEDGQDESEGDPEEDEGSDDEDPDDDDDVVDRLEREGIFVEGDEDDVYMPIGRHPRLGGMPRHPLGMPLGRGPRSRRHRHSWMDGGLMDGGPGGVDIQWIVEDETGMPVEADGEMPIFSRLAGAPRNAPPPGDDTMAHPLLVHQHAASPAHSHRFLDVSGRGLPPSGAPRDIQMRMDDFMGGDPLAFLEQLFSRGLRGLPSVDRLGPDSVVTRALPGGAGIAATFTLPPSRGTSSAEGGAGAEGEGTSTTEDQLSIIHSFTPLSTTDRWWQEVRLMYGNTVQEKATKVENALLNALIPVAVEEDKQRRAKEEAERKAREEEERKKREEEEVKQKEEEEKRKKEEEEKKRKEEEEAAARAAAAPVVDTDVAMGEAAPMETDESAAVAEGEAPAAPPAQPAEPAQPPQRVVVMVHGQEVDITGTDMDVEFLEALPDDMRMDVINQHRREQGRAQRSTTEIPTTVNSEFLDALPADIREELLAQERAEEQRRRRAAQPPAAGVAGAAAPAEMDPASFLISLDAGLRGSVLMDLQQDEGLLATLPPALMAEAGAIRSSLSRRFGDRYGMRAHPHGPGGVGGHPTPARKTTHREAVQLVDRQELMTVLRLLFIPEPVSKPLLHKLLVNVAENSKTRNDLVALLLSILADGSTDLSMVDKSFSQMSLHRKSSKSSLKTPQRTPGGAGAGGVAGSSGSAGAVVGETIPNLVATRCLEALRELVNYNEQMAQYFLTENENLLIGHGGKAGRTPGSAKKNKGKEKAVTGNFKYPVVVLLSLLDRPVFLENSALMEQLMQLLMMITRPLSTIGKKAQGKDGKDGKIEGAASGMEGVAATAQPPAEPSAGTAPEGTSTTAGTEVAASTQAGGDPASSAATQTETKPSSETKPTETELKPPAIPEQHVRGVVNVLTAGPVSSKTFQYTLSVIQSLSILEGNGDIISHELAESAQRLGDAMISDLDELVHVLTVATTAVDVNSATLAKFSPSSALQAKLLRVLKTIDYLNGKKSGADVQGAGDVPAVEGGAQGDGTAAGGAGAARTGSVGAGAGTAEAGKEEGRKEEDTLVATYNKLQYAKLWQRLGAVLATINEKEAELIHVATVMLPLIESFMVVSKPYVLNKPPVPTAAAQTAPPTLARATTKLIHELYAKHNDELFVAFTEEHRKILNTMVRNNPSLMSGSFSLLVKNPKILEFDNKRTFFNQQIHKRGQRDMYGSLPITVRRKHLFEDSYHQFQGRTGDEIKYGKLNVRFHDEEGVDAGGVTREWFSELAKEIFNPDYALFRPSAIDKVTYQPNPLSRVNQDHLLYFRFVGRIIGKAVYDGRLLDCYFTRSFYKAIIEAPVDYKDMEAVDPEFHKSLEWILNNDITDILDLTFSSEVDDFGVKRVIDLKENGRNIAVTDQNKHEYVKLIVEHKLVTAIKEQIEAFLKGFYDIIPKELIKIFNEQELELLISGLPDIDIDDWKNNTEYQNYTGSSPPVQWFWRAVRSFNQEERAKLMQFATGTSKVPLEGFKALQGMHGVQKFQIHKDFATGDRLPSAHTCFNQIDLPQYESYEALRSNLLLAISECGTDYPTLTYTNLTNNPHTTTAYPMSRVNDTLRAEIDDMVDSFLSLADEPGDTPDSPWQLAASIGTPFVEVYKHKASEFCFKVVADLDASPETAFDLLSDITRRGEWDDMTVEAGVVETVNGSTKYQYMTSKAIWPAAARDSLVLSYVTRLTDNRYLNVTRSTTHPSYPPRDAEGIIRMEAKIAGQLVSPSPSATPGTCRVVQVADGDLKGWIPKSVIGFIATKATPQSFKSLNMILCRLPQTNVSQAILEAEADESGGEGSSSVGEEENGRGGEDWAAVSEIRTTAAPVVESRVVSPPVRASPALAPPPPALTVARRTPSLGVLGRIRTWLEWLQPWFITVLFVMKVWARYKRWREGRKLVGQ
ncbi:hypothetical protein HDV00_006990 [Rhizophlyctis rosea]|nr:hypothetical protein HDV00_006990 [Rhizophlyctis rosea]